MDERTLVRIYACRLSDEIYINQRCLLKKPFAEMHRSLHGRDLAQTHAIQNVICVSHMTQATTIPVSVQLVRTLIKPKIRFCE